MARPFFEPETLDPAARSDIQGHQSGFNQQGAGTTHGVNKVTTGSGNVRPAGTHQQGGRQVFLQGCQAFLRAIAPHVQAVATEVEPHRQPAPVQASRNGHVRVFRSDGRPWHAGTADAVNDTVFNFLGTKLGVTDLFVLAQEGHAETARRRDMGLPVQRHYAFVKFLGTAGVYLGDVQHYPVGQARPQAGTVARLQRALYPDSRRRITHLCQTKTFQFISQEILNALRAGYEKYMFGQNKLLVFLMKPVSRRIGSKTRFRAVIDMQ